MVRESMVLKTPLRWLLQATLLGTALGLGIHLALGGPLWVPHQSVLIGIIFSLVMWSGFDLLHPPIERLPRHWPAARIGLFSVASLLLLYLMLLAISIGLVRLTTGINFLHARTALIFSGLAGLAASGIIGLKETVEHHVQAARALAEAEARAGFLGLQAQLQPHTLFNALNTIAALIPQDPRLAEEATERLSALLRQILSALERPEWPLRDELDLLLNLLRLEELRFGDRLTFSLEVAPDMAETNVQPLLLLPLVENALRHGFRTKVGPCHLKLLAAGGCVRIEDDGVGRQADAPEGVGLRTVRERLQATGGELRWPPVGQGCAVEVRL